MVQEFKDFVNRGKLVEIAVAFVMGVAFAAVITSLTNDVINPIIAKIFDVQDLNGSCGISGSARSWLRSSNGVRAR